MRSAPVSSNYPLPIYLINNYIILLLNRFIYNQIKAISHPQRFNMIQKCNSNNLLNYLNIYDRLFPYQAERILSMGIYNYAEISTLHEAVIMIIKAVSSDSLSKDNFNIRRMLMEGVSEVSTDTIEKYLDDSPIKFHLFAYLNEIIFDRLELKEHKKEVLKHRLDYSDKYERLSKDAMAERLNLTTGRTYLLEQSLERDIMDIIRVFRVFSPFYSYKSKYLSEKQMVKISPTVFDCIRKEEGVEEMTDAFIAKVLSVIYNYALDDELCRENEEYLLIDRGKIKSTFVRIGNQKTERN
jgi:hypothetical protein